MALTVLIGLVLLAAAVVARANISGAAEVAASSADAERSGRPRVTAPEHCRSTRHAIPFFRGRTWDWQLMRSGGLADRTPVARSHSCHWARYALTVHSARMVAARKSFYRWRDRLESDPVAAICSVFGDYCSQAVGVAKCEGGLSPNAHNGQYLGTFQMGDAERRTYGHGATVLEQARAAWRYFVASGRDWSPWSCRWAAGR